MLDAVAVVDALVYCLLPFDRRIGSDNLFVSFLAIPDLRMMMNQSPYFFFLAAIGDDDDLTLYCLDYHPSASTSFTFLSVLF